MFPGGVAGLDDRPVDLGAGEDLTSGGGVEPGLQDCRGVGVLGQFVVAHQPQHTVVFVRGDRDASYRAQEPVGAAGPLRRVQPVQDVGDGGVRGVCGLAARAVRAWTRRCSECRSRSRVGRSWSGSTLAMMRIRVRLGAGETTAG